MTQEEAEALVAGQKIQYWDGRVATVTQAAGEIIDSPPDPPARKIHIIFDAEPDPRPTYRIKSFDFLRASVIEPGFVFEDTWKWTTSPSASHGQIRGDGDDWNAISQLWINNMSNGGIDRAGYLRAVQDGDAIRLQQSGNAAIWNKYSVTGAPIDNTTWVQYAVTLLEGASVGPPGNNQACLVSFFTP